MKTILLLTSLLFLLFIKCSSIKNNLSHDQIVEMFYYDSLEFAMIKLNPTDNPGIVNKYKEWRESNIDASPNTFYRTYFNEQNTNYNKNDTINMIQKSKLLEHPKIKYPLEAPIIGGFLAVRISVVIDTLGHVEYAQLYDINRKKENIKPYKEGGNKTPWKNMQISPYDIPFIKLSLKNAIGSLFKPGYQENRPVKVKMTMPYFYRI